MCQAQRGLTAQPGATNTGMPSQHAAVPSLCIVAAGAAPPIRSKNGTCGVCSVVFARIGVLLQVCGTLAPGFRMKHWQLSLSPAVSLCLVVASRYHACCFVLCRHCEERCCQERVGCSDMCLSASCRHELCVHCVIHLGGCFHVGSQQRVCAPVVIYSFRVGGSWGHSQRQWLAAVDEAWLSCCN